jgi:hypothetical protein
VFDESEIAILRDSGHEDAASILAAVRKAKSGTPTPDPVPAGAAPAAAPAATPAPAPEIPAAYLVPAPVAAAQPQGPAPPPGKAPLTAADLDTISQAEAVKRMDEVEWLERHPS